MKKKIIAIATAAAVSLGTAAPATAQTVPNPAQLSSAANQLVGPNAGGFGALIALGAGVLAVYALLEAAGHVVHLVPKPANR